MAFLTVLTFYSFGVLQFWCFDGFDSFDGFDGFDSFDGIAVL